MAARSVFPAAQASVPAELAPQDSRTAQSEVSIVLYCMFIDCTLDVQNLSDLANMSSDAARSLKEPSIIFLLTVYLICVMEDLCFAEGFYFAVAWSFEHLLSI